MRKAGKILSVIGLLVLFGLSACSDNESPKNHGQPPSIPNLAQIVHNPDLSYFKNASITMKTTSKTATPSKTGDASNFKQAKINTFNAIGMLALAQGFSSFLNTPDVDQAKFVDGKWVWQYNYDFNESTYSLKLTAKESSDKVAWALFVSYDTSSQSIDNFKFMEGTAAKDGHKGQWQMNGFGPNSEVLINFNWLGDVTDGDPFTLNLTFNNGDGSKSTIRYDVKKPVYEINYNSANGETFLIHWNEDTEVGFYTDSEGMKHCWDASYHNVNCPRPIG